VKVILYGKIYLASAQFKWYLPVSMGGETEKNLKETDLGWESSIVFRRHRFEMIPQKIY